MKIRILLAGVAAALALSAGAAQAIVVFSFSGTCTSGCTGAAFANLTLTDAYVYGTALGASTFMGLSYTSSSGHFDINFPTTFGGGLNADGSLSGPSLEIAESFQNIFSVHGGTAQVTHNFGTPIVDSLSGGFLPAIRFDPHPPPVAAVPEPATWAMMILGLGAIGGALRARRRRGTDAPQKLGHYRRRSGWMRISQVGKMKTRILVAGVAAALSLVAGGAQAAIVFNFSGSCTNGCSGAATGLLTLTDAYVFGTDITNATFGSLSFSSSQFSFDISSPLHLHGGLNADGSVSGSLVEIDGAGPGSPIFIFSGPSFTALKELDQGFVVEGGSGGFTLAGSAVPEPAVWTTMILGLGAIGSAFRTRRRRGTQATRAEVFTPAC
ncbi:MAG: hypothetical protein JWQ29_624 [Phenylobacterium sp.]|nr:hypothetical protein [Phenylobacterium sp.]